MGYRKTRVLHLISSGFVGGPEKQILHHALQATSVGMEMWVGSFRDGPDRSAILGRAEDLGLPTVELRRAKFDPRVIYDLVNNVHHHRISILCTHGYKANFLGWLASRLGGFPQIAFARGWTAETWRVRQYDRLERLALGRADWVVCVSRPQAERLKRRREGRNPPLVVPNAVLMPLEDTQQGLERCASRNRLGLSGDGFYVGAVGRLSVEKGHCYLVDAVSRLLPHIPNLRLVLVGEGRERTRLEQQLTRLEIQTRVIFCGFQTDVRPWIKACDVIVNPSLTEGMPNIVLEAMALGTPVIATAVGGVPDMIEDQVSGLLVPPADPAALARSLTELFTNPSKGLELARCAQARVREFSPEKQTRRLLDLYADVLRAKPRGLVWFHYPFRRIGDASRTNAFRDEN